MAGLYLSLTWMVSVVGMYKWCSLAVGRDQKKKKKKHEKKSPSSKVLCGNERKGFLARYFMWRNRPSYCWNPALWLWCRQPCCFRSGLVHLYRLNTKGINGCSALRGLVLLQIGSITPCLSDSFKAECQQGLCCAVGV